MNLIMAIVDKIYVLKSGENFILMLTFLPTGCFMAVGGNSINTSFKPTIIPLYILLVVLHV